MFASQASAVYQPLYYLWATFTVKKIPSLHVRHVPQIQLPVDFFSIWHIILGVPNKLKKRCTLPLSGSQKSGVLYHEWELKKRCTLPWVGAKKAKDRTCRSFLCTEVLMNLKFYHADAGYCDFLRQADPCVPYIQDDKNTRPFIGILLTVGGINYFAPLTSPKPMSQKSSGITDNYRSDIGLFEWANRCVDKRIAYEAIRRGRDKRTVLSSH